MFQHFYSKTAHGCLGTSRCISLVHKPCPSSPVLIPARSTPLLTRTLLLGFLSSFPFKWHRQPMKSQALTLTPTWISTRLSAGTTSFEMRGNAWQVFPGGLAKNKCTLLLNFHLSTTNISPLRVRLKHLIYTRWGICLQSPGSPSTQEGTAKPTLITYVRCPRSPHRRGIF